MQRKTTSVNIAGQEIIFETGKIARQAHGSVIVRSGETMVMATACRSDDPLQDIDFLPLRIDYQERFSSTGKTVSGFVKREGKPTQNEILVSRLIDRPIRPMFEDGYYHDVQILSSVISYDGATSPDVLAICAASAALALSDIPLLKPIAAVRVGLIENRFIINPSVQEQENSILDLVLAGTEDAILMIEGSAHFLTEEQVLEAIETGHSAVKKICHTLAAWQKAHGTPKYTDSIMRLADEVVQAVEAHATTSYDAALRIHEKKRREKQIGSVTKELVEALCGENAVKKFDKISVNRAASNLQSKIMRKMILNENIRCDGRNLTTIRSIDIEQSLLPRAHGSSLFTRGETQTLAVCVLGNDNMGQRYEDLNNEGTQRFYLQYFFPPFSVGEVGRIGMPGRREIGHGKLAERAIAAALPTKEQFPYTIRLESNITESNGSSSMASVCGGCLALMDAGVPIKRPVSGIAMGLIIEDSRFAILSDILGTEDALGDMDFKVTGDKDGITAFQMDIKVEGITLDIMKQALQQAKQGRIHILEKMLTVCPHAKAEMSIYAPRIETMQVKPSKIAVIIGPGGKQIRAIIEETGVDIDINDDGLVSISSASAEGILKAKEIIHSLTAEVEIGKIYTGTVTSIVDFGMFVEILPGKEGLCHISELDTHRIENIMDYAKSSHLQVGSQITVEVLNINERGQVKLSRKVPLMRQKRSEAHV